MCAILAGLIGEGVGFAAFRLSQVFTDWLISKLSSQPRFFEGVPVGFVLIPPPHDWNVEVITGSIIAIIAYLMHTSALPEAVYRKRRVIFNAVLIILAVLVGRGVDFVFDWGVLVMAFHDVVQVSVMLWVMWRLIEWTSYLLARRVQA
ncbi:MAG: hypothetical protein C4335_11355 [Armatimonadota bacterium]